MKYLLIAFFVLSSASYGGEWHSAGNAPVAPYQPAGPLEYDCQFSVVAHDGRGNSLRSDPVKLRVTEKDFRDSWNSVVSLTTAGNLEGVLNGHVMHFRFRKDWRQPGRELMELTLNLNVKDQGSANSTAKTPRPEKYIDTYSSLTFSKKIKGRARSISAFGSCRDLLP